MVGRLASRNTPPPPPPPPPSSLLPSCACTFASPIPRVFSLPLFSPLPPALGAAYGTAKSGVGIAAMSVMRPDLIMKSVIPVVMAGIIAIYGLVVSVLVANKRKCMSFYLDNSATSLPHPSPHVTHTLALHTPSLPLTSCIIPLLRNSLRSQQY